MTQDKLLQLSPDEQAVVLRHLAALLDAAHHLACKIELSCMLFGPDDRHGDTPVTARQRYAEWLAALPYDLYQDPREHEPDVLDTPRNRTLLVQLITSRFPSARITAWRNRPANRQGNDSWELFQIDVYVHDLSDLEEPEASGESSG